MNHPDNDSSASDTILPGGATENEDSSTGTRPLQGAFNREQVAFLDRFLPKFMALDDKKGTKKKWVWKYPYPAYIAEFDSAGSDGVNLHSLEEACNFLVFCHDHYLTEHVENVPLVHQPREG